MLYQSYQPALSQLFIGQKKKMKQMAKAMDNMKVRDKIQKQAQYQPEAVLPKEQNLFWNSLRKSIVKEIDASSLAIDWGNMKRFDEWRSTRKSDQKYRGEEAQQTIEQHKRHFLQTREEREAPGFTTKDIALDQAFSTTIPHLRFMGPQKISTPQQRGTVVHQGTPQQNSMMIARALRLMGAAYTGFVELYDETTRKLIYGKEVKGGKSILFEDVDIGFETESSLVIPNAAKWVIVYCIPMSNAGLSQAPTRLSRATTMQAYTRLFTIYNQLHEFIRGLGYHSYGATIMNGFGIYPAFAVLGGLGELSRMDVVITPEYGPMVRLAAMATDLPLAATPPISFGVEEYCENCRICTDACIGIKSKLGT